MRINSKALAVVILVTLFAGIAASSALGFWSTEGGGGGQGAGSPAESGEAGDGLIRGRTTFQELLDLGLPQDRIERVLGGEIPQAGMRVKDYCTQVGLDFETIKEQLQSELDQQDR
jgi:hypothetical protein